MNAKVFGDRCVTPSTMCQPACKLEVLLVEDNPGDVRLVREALKEGGFPGHLNVAMDGDEATDILWKRGDHKNDPRPDLIMLDLNPTFAAAMSFGVKTGGSTR